MEGLPDDDAMKALLSNAEQATSAKFQEEISDMHESMQDMFLQKLREQIDVRRAEIQNDVNKQVLMQRRNYEKIMRSWERRKIATSARKLSKHFHVGCKASIADWSCLQISPGEGQLARWLARVGCNVVGLETDEDKAFKAQNLSASAGLIERCIFVKGELSRLAKGDALSFLDVRRALKRFVSGEFAEYSDVVRRMLEQEAAGNSGVGPRASCKTLILHHVLLEQRIRDDSTPLFSSLSMQKTKNSHGEFELVVDVDPSSVARHLQSPEHLEVSAT
eukprot:755748-Hanusia_phi.AAC.6